MTRGTNKFAVKAGGIRHSRAWENYSREDSK